MNITQDTTTARWPRWVTFGAAAWSLAYGGLGLYWTLGGAGFPFGEGDNPDARAESLLGAATAAGTAPLIAALGFAGAVLALAMGALRRRGAVPALRVTMLVPAWAAALLLIVLIPDARIMTAVGYAPIFLIGAPFGWPDADYFALAFPWEVINLMICVAGGLLWAAAALAFQRSTAGACESCGRTEGHARAWTTPAAAATWGRWAAYTAFVVPMFYAVVRWAWALKIPLLLSQEDLAGLHESGLVWAGAGLATFAALGGLLTLGLVQRWGVIWPRWVLGLAGRPVPRALPITAATLVAAVIASASQAALRTMDWSDPAAWLSSPMAYWPIWAVALAAATLAYYYRTRPTCGRCSPVQEHSTF